MLLLASPINQRIKSNKKDATGIFKTLREQNSKNLSIWPNWSIFLGKDKLPKITPRERKTKQTN